MQFRENILNYLVSKLQEITEDNGYDITVKTVTRKQYLPDTIDVIDCPLISVTDGDERREYYGARVVHYFNVILKCWLYDEENVSTPMNKLLQAITDLLAEDLYLGGNCDRRVYITDVEVDEGWLFPLGYMEVTIETSVFREECEV